MADVLIFTIVWPHLKISCVYFGTSVRLKKIQKSKKSHVGDLPFFIRKAAGWPAFGIGGLE